MSRAARSGGAAEQESGEGPGLWRLVIGVAVVSYCAVRAVVWMTTEPLASPAPSSPPPALTIPSPTPAPQDQDRLRGPSPELRPERPLRRPEMRPPRQNGVRKIWA
ncbi:MAG: hypothetical protein AAGM38_09875 [Pseudomonadota bacterium]